MQDVLLTAAHLFIFSVLLYALTFSTHLASPTIRNTDHVSSGRPVLGLLQRFTDYASGPAASSANAVCRADDQWQKFYIGGITDPNSFMKQLHQLRE